MDEIAQRILAGCFGVALVVFALGYFIGRIAKEEYLPAQDNSSWETSEVKVSYPEGTSSDEIEKHIKDVVNKSFGLKKPDVV